MKHPSIRNLLDYWLERRGARAAPERDDIEPEAIRSLLADAFILSFEGSRGLCFRLAGTRVCALLGREVKGQAFLNLFSSDTRNQVQDLAAIIAHEALGVAAGARELSLDLPGTELELLLLPLRHHGRTDARLLGALAAHEPPEWLGSRALGELELGSYCFVGRPTGADFFIQGRDIPTHRVRHGLIVHQGGQAGRLPDSHLKSSFKTRILAQTSHKEWTNNATFSNN